MVFCFLISRLSRTSRFLYRLALLLSLNVVMILGLLQFMAPDEHSRACLEMPEMLFSDLVDETSL